MARDLLYITYWFIDKHDISFDYFHKDEIVYQTDKAYLVKLKKWKNKQIWIPKSQTTTNPNGRSIKSDNYYRGHDDPWECEYDDDWYGGPH